MNSKLIAVLTSMVLITAVIVLAIFVNQRESLMLDGQAQVSFLQHPVQIYFDQLSIPYIEARSEKDLTIAQGYVTASQRLFQMDMLRRIAKGETAAILGSTCLTNDKLAHILGFKRIAEAEYPLLAPETQKWLKSYCQGVNAYISQGKLPLEFILLGYEPQPWQPEDTLAILKYLQYASDECWQVNILQDAIAQKGGLPLAKQMFGPSFKTNYLPTASQSGSSISSPQSSLSSPEISPQIKNENLQYKDLNHPDSKHQEIHHSAINRIGWQHNNQPKNFYKTKELYKLISSLPPAAGLSWGSTGWTVSQNLSKSKGSLLACDKDTLFNFPDLFFLSALRAPFIHVAGITIPGVPGILIGRNDNISWAAISLKKRSQELCFEQFSDKIPDQYQNNRGVFKAQVIQEEIANRFAANRMEKIIITKDGPLLTKNGSSGIALSWYGLNPANNVIDSIWLINKAKNWSDFSTALEKYRGNVQTFLYTDTTGGIAQYIAGYNRHSGQLISATKQTSSPEEGETSHPPNYLIANEAQSSASSALSNIVNDAASGNNWAAQRINQILARDRTAKVRVGLEDMIALQADSKAPLSELVTKTIQKALIETKNIDQYERDAVAQLNNWDGQLKANSVCASIYESFLVYTTKKLLEPQIGKQLTTEYINRWPYWTKFTGQILDKQTINLLPGNEHSFAIFNLNCLSQSLKNLRLIFHTGPIPGNMQKFQWQKLHQLDFHDNIAKFVPEALVNLASPFLPNKIGIGGDQDCLNACNYQISDQSPFYICNSGPTARLLIDMSDNDKFYHSLIFGQSGHLFSKDRIDHNQLESWRNMEFHAIAFSKKQLERIVRHNLTLSNQVE